MFLSNEGPTLEMLDFTFHIGGTPTFLYFDLYLYAVCKDTTFISTFSQPFYISIPYLNTAYAAHYLYFFIKTVISLALIDVIF